MVVDSTVRDGTGGCGGFTPGVENIRHAEFYGQTFAQSSVATLAFATVSDQNSRKRLACGVRSRGANPACGRETAYMPNPLNRMERRKACMFRQVGLS
jgi:hypothetical protein